MKKIIKVIVVILQVICLLPAVPFIILEVIKRKLES